MDFATRCFNSFTYEMGTTPNLPPRETAKENTFEGFDTITRAVSESLWKHETCTQDRVNTNHLLVTRQQSNTVGWEETLLTGCHPTPRTAQGRVHTESMIHNNVT